MVTSKEFWTKKTLVGLGLGQLLSLLITSTGFSSSELARKGLSLSLSLSLLIANLQPYFFLFCYLLLILLFMKYKVKHIILDLGIANLRFVFF